jgi:glyoxylase-like metal-dependent hydrolase (beta-lactamase superfamily II)
MQIHIIPGYIQSIYLAEYNDKLLLLDGCCRADVEVIEAFITETLNREMAALKLIVVTHMHPDHAGAAQLLKKRHGIEIASAVKNKHWYHGLSGAWSFLVDLSLAYYVVKAHGKVFKNLWYARKLQPDHVVEDLDCLPYFDDWQVVNTPGHTDRDISLYHSGSKQMYIADTILKIKGKFIPPFPICHPNQYKKSLSRLTTFDVDSFLMAHGGKSAISSEKINHLLDEAPQLPRRYGYFIKRFFKLVNHA